MTTPYTMKKYTELAEMEVDVFKKITEQFKKKMDLIARNTYYIKRSNIFSSDLENDYSFTDKLNCICKTTFINIIHNRVLWGNIDKFLKNLDITENINIYRDENNNMHCTDNYIYIEPLDSEYYMLCIRNESEGWEKTTKKPISRENLIDVLNELRIQNVTASNGKDLEQYS